jgi:anti-sigma factor RsiW
MNCAKWKIDIALYAGGDLPANRLARTVAHLEACAECRALLDDLRAGQTLLSDLGDEPLEDAMAANVRRRVLARLPVEQAATAHSYWRWALAAAVLLAAILTLPWRMEKQAPLARVEHAPPRVPEAPPAIVNVPRPVARRHHRAKPQPGEPLLVQLVTDDPNIVIYWLVDPKPQGD